MQTPRVSKVARFGATFLSLALTLSITQSSFANGGRGHRRKIATSQKRPQQRRGIRRLYASRLRKGNAALGLKAGRVTKAAQTAVSRSGKSKTEPRKAAPNARAQEKGTKRNPDRVGVNAKLVAERNVQVAAARKSKYRFDAFKVITGYTAAAVLILSGVVYVQNRMHGFDKDAVLLAAFGVGLAVTTVVLDALSIHAKVKLRRLADSGAEED